MPVSDERRERLPLTPAVRAVIVACSALYVAALAFDPRASLHVTSPLRALSPSDTALFRLGMTSGPLVAYGCWWTVLTATFLHGGILHVVFNMLWTREIGVIVERVWGPARFFVIYAAGGVAGFVLSNAVLGAPSIGASGAVFGLIGALIVLGRRRRAAAFTKQMWQTAVALFVVGFLFPGVNQWGHAGGFAGGFVASAALPLADERPEGRGVRAVALVVALAALGGVIASLVVTRGLD